MTAWSWTTESSPQRARGHRPLPRLPPPDRRTFPVRSSLSLDASFDGDCASGEGRTCSGAPSATPAPSPGPTDVPRPFLARRVVRRRLRVRRGTDVPAVLSPFPPVGRETAVDRWSHNSLAQVREDGFTLIRPDGGKTVPDELSPGRVVLFNSQLRSNPLSLSYFQDSPPGKGHGPTVLSHRPCLSRPYYRLLIVAFPAAIGRLSRSLYRPNPTQSSCPGTAPPRPSPSDPRRDPSFESNDQ